MVLTPKPGPDTSGKDGSNPKPGLENPCRNGVNASVYEQRPATMARVKALRFISKNLYFLKIRLISSLIELLVFRIELLV